MSQARLLQFAESVFRETCQGKLQWQATGTPGQYAAVYSGFHFKIAPKEASWVFMVCDAKGMPVDQLDMNNHPHIAHGSVGGLYKKVQELAGEVGDGDDLLGMFEKK